MVCEIAASDLSLMLTEGMPVILRRNVLGQRWEKCSAFRVFTKLCQKDCAIDLFANVLMNVRRPTNVDCHATERYSLKFARFLFRAWSSDQLQDPCQGDACGRWQGALVQVRS